MTGVVISGIAIVIGVAVFILLAYKGLSPILAALAAAIIVGCTCEGGPLTAVSDTDVYKRQGVSTAVSFAIAFLLLKVAGKDTSLEEAQAKKDEMKRQSKGMTAPAGSQAATSAKISKIAFACDAGMGSSAMGATVLKKKLAAAGITGIEVIHTPVSSIPADVQLVVTHEELGERAAHSNPDAQLVLITNFLAAPQYDEVVEQLKNQ